MGIRVLQITLMFLLSVVPHLAQAQYLSLQTGQQIPASLPNTNGIMTPTYYLPSGSQLYMDSSWAIRNEMTNQVDYMLSLNNWMQSLQPGDAAGLYQMSNGNYDFFFPFTVANAPGFSPGQTVYLPYESISLPNAMNVTMPPPIESVVDTQIARDFRDIQEERELRREIRAERVSSTTEARYCTSCIGGSAPGAASEVISQSVTAIPTAAMGPSSAGDMSARWSSAEAPRLLSRNQVSRPRIQHARCDNFMDDSDGSVGEWGETIARLLLSDEYRATYFNGRNTLGGLCPKFNNLTPQRQLQAWVWFWTSLANEESKCDPTVVHGTHANGRRINPRQGYGLWAAERDRNVRMGRYRGDHGDCRNIDSVQGQAVCAISTMKETQLNVGRTADVRSGGYWGPVHRANTQLMPHMRRFAECF